MRDLQLHHNSCRPNDEYLAFKCDQCGPVRSADVYEDSIRVEVSKLNDKISILESKISELEMENLEMKEALIKANNVTGLIFYQWKLKENLNKSEVK